MTKVSSQSSTAKFSMMPRYLRQTKAFEWCKKAFGDAVVVNKPERGARMLEEALELAQATGVTEEMAAKLVKHVFSRPVGVVAQEAGQLQLTLLILCEQFGFQADWEEATELARVIAKTDADPKHFAARLNAKADAGVAIYSEV